MAAARPSAAYAQGKLFDSVRDILANNGLTPACVDTIGVSCGGPLNSKAGIILCPPNLNGWVNVPFVQMLVRFNPAAEKITVCRLAPA